jgi:hypothetical protein
MLVAVLVRNSTLMQRHWSGCLTTPFLPLHPAFSSCQ